MQPLPEVQAEGAHDQEVDHPFLGVVLRREADQADTVAAALRRRAQALDADLDLMEASEREGRSRLDTARMRDAPPSYNFV